MADTSNLTPIQPKQERINPRRMLGGTLEDTIEYSVSSILGGPYGNEGQGSTADLSRTIDLQEAQELGLENSSITGFQRARRREDVYPQLSTEKLRRELRAAHLHQVTQLPVKDKRVYANELLGFQSGYQVPVDRSGNYSGEYYENGVEKAEGERDRLAKKKAEREQMLAQARRKAAPKAAIGPTVNMNTTFEDQNMNRPG